MVEGLMGRKIAMTQIFDEEGSALPCTVLHVGPCVVVQRREVARDGYEAVQLGLVEAVKVKNAGKARQGHFAKANLPPTRKLREFRILPGGDAPAVGDKVLVSLFKAKDKVDVIAVSKGKGFQGGVRRYGWYGGDATHGSMFHRAPGSIGASSDPSRVWPGHHLPGRMGGDRRTVLNLSVVRVMPEQNLVLVRGAVPGANGSLVMLRKSVKATRAQQAQQKGAEKK